MEPLRIKWDLFIIILAIYNSIAIPISLAFSPPSFKYFWVLALNNIIDICFLCDIIMQFRTTYFNPITGDEETDLKKIAKNYIKGSFWIDTLSTIPFEKMVHLFIETVDTLEHSAEDHTGKYNVISCLKLVRVLRLGRLINYCNESDDFKL